MRIGLFVQFGLLSLVSSIAVTTAQSSQGLVIGTVYAALLTALAFWMLREPAKLSFLGGGLPVVVVIGVLLVLVAASNERHYLAVRNAPHFATSAPALELPAWLLVHGHEPYRDHLADGAPISPGPGWFMLLSPFTLPHLTAILGALSLGLVVLLLRRDHRYAAGVFFVLVFLQPSFQAQITNGQDLFVVSFALVCLALAAERLDDSSRKALILGVVAGFVATARIPIVLMTTILGYGVFLKDRRTGCYFTVSMLLTSGLLHGIFAVWAHRMGHMYQPMHVFGRATNGAGLSARVAVIILLACSLGWIALRMKPMAYYWMVGMYLAMFSLFVPEAIKEFVQSPRWDWEGSIYITFPLPLLIGALVLIYARAPATHDRAVPAAAE
ncbi:hypothetical protein [Mycobacterium sp. 1423905.2]|uniref:hypothetical protein n=1 Tax=Mycobacterium sp. 1423905.2 TaxID=1856859 RepID=UPI0012EACBFC|nr:hypothetical protein [Mycobacterium sp. 1423905.2]